ncbi:MAG: response regulator [Desulfobacteraceae bacterium]|nr:response regulator [Desulfobacteraceae bacterium]
MTHKILIIEDDPTQILLAYKMLEKEEEYEILQARDASEARTYLKQNNVDIVLCDIGLPGESGLDLTKYIVETYKNTIVIILSANEDMQTSELAIKNGAFSYLVKPVKASQLRISVLNAIKKQNYQKIINEQKIELKEKTQDLENIEMEFNNVIEEFTEFLENVKTDKVDERLIKDMESILGKG